MARTSLQAKPCVGQHVALGWAYIWKFIFTFATGQSE